MCQDHKSLAPRLPQESGSPAALVVSLAVIAVWLLGSHFAVSALTDLNPSTVPWISFPSIDCLMQSAHCFP